MMPLIAAAPKFTSGVTVVATITVAKPETAPTVACTELTYVPLTTPAVNRPVPLLMLPAVAFTTDHTGTIARMLPLASLPTAENVCVPPMARLLGFGVTVIVASRPDAMFVFTVANPEIVPRVALIVFVNTPTVLPDVKLPTVSMTPPPFTTDQTGFRANTFPLESRPMARNCCSALVGMNTGFGVTVMAASGPLVTVIVAKPAIEPLEARTLLMNVPVTVPAVYNPACVMLAPFAVVTTAHVGVNTTTFPAASFPTAVNCCVPLIDMIAGFGVMVMLASGPPVTVTVAVPESVPLVAVTELVNVPGVIPAVNIPPPSTVPPPAALDQVVATTTVFPPSSFPVATNCCLAPTISAAGFGVTVRVVTGPTVTMTVANAVMP